MKLAIFISLLVANLPSGVSYVRGAEKSATLCSMVEFELAPVNTFPGAQA